MRRRLKMLRWLLPLLACVRIAALPQDEGTAYDGDPYHGAAGNEMSCTWTCVVFTMQWPAAFCQSLDNASLCTIPEHVDTWTIHGLWPMKVQQCCRCWPMFFSDVQELQDALEECWPSLLKSRSSFHFWRDEWEKHGTCAACVEGLNSPLRYFQTCLKLRGRFDLRKALEDAGIKPSCDRPYKLSEVQDVLAPLLGHACEIQCIKDDKGREVWFQVKIRLSRNLTVGCEHAADVTPISQGHPCPAQGTFYLLPIDWRRPSRPCD
ncbi:ribonuclease T2-like [Syngnathus acus]|uniref:ribonuclease T2-like n=1 Tax=Syngnathus acus TaxID=161584 RepID=UPI0018861EFD|nr:ribonuclease T2-like [Syngnathus acus]XP_037123228.1 ribonuclease T2-like [Syngnathus acus]XP_037123229.1 ribonuclease T2-like [Syngnathus acus]